LSRYNARYNISMRSNEMRAFYDARYIAL